MLVRLLWLLLRRGRCIGRGGEAFYRLSYYPFAGSALDESLPLALLVDGQRCQARFHSKGESPLEKLRSLPSGNSAVLSGPSWR